MGNWWYGDGLTEQLNIHPHDLFGAMILFGSEYLQFTKWLVRGAGQQAACSRKLSPLNARVGRVNGVTTFRLWKELAS